MPRLHLACLPSWPSAPQDCQKWEQTVGQPCRPLQFWMPWVQKRWEHLLSSNILVIQSPLNHQIRKGPESQTFNDLDSDSQATSQLSSGCQTKFTHLYRKTLCTENFPTVALKACMWGKTETEQQKGAQVISSLGDQNSWLPQSFLEAQGEGKKMSTALAFGPVLTKNSGHVSWVSPCCL